MNGLDIAVIVIIVLSALFAFSRGFVKEVLSIGAWVGAALAALWGYPYAAALTERMLPKGPVAEGVAAFVIFIVALIVLSFLTSALSSRVKTSALSAVDRTLGLIFGIVRGAIIVCLGYIALAWVLPADGHRPAWMAEARTLPLLEAGAERLTALMPAHLRQRATATAGETKRTVDRAKEAEGAIRALSTPHNPAPPATPNAARGYTDDARRDLDRLIQQNSQ